MREDEDKKSSFLKHESPVGILQLVGHKTPVHFFPDGRKFLLPLVPRMDWDKDPRFELDEVLRELQFSPLHFVSVGLGFVQPWANWSEFGSS